MAHIRFQSQQIVARAHDNRFELLGWPMVLLWPIILAILGLGRGKSRLWVSSFSCFMFKIVFYFYIFPKYCVLFLYFSKMFSIILLFKVCCNIPIKGIKRKNSSVVWRNNSLWRRWRDTIPALSFCVLNSLIIRLHLLNVKWSTLHRRIFM